MGRVLDWAVTLLFLPVFGLVLLVFEVVQRVAKAFGKRPHDYAVGGLCTSLVTAFRITGLRLKVERSPAVRSHQAYLIISNHQSMFDIALLGHVFFTNFPKFVSKRSLARRIPSVSYNLQRGGNCLIDRDDAEQALGAIRALGERVERNGVSAVIFPEGTRARAGAPATAIVPVAIDESWRLMRANFLPIPFGVRVRVHIGDPIRRRPDEDHAELLDRVHDEIAAALAAIRGETVELPRRAAAR